MAKRYIQKARQWAREHYADPSDNDVEVLDGAEVYPSGDDGLWVAARVYVRLSDLDAA